jgi:hypothetical protein
VWRLERNCKRSRRGSVIHVNATVNAEAHSSARARLKQPSAVSTEREHHTHLSFPHDIGVGGWLELRITAAAFASL